VLFVSLLRFLDTDTHTLSSSCRAREGVQALLHGRQEARSAGTYTTTYTRALRLSAVG